MPNEQPKEQRKGEAKCGHWIDAERYLPRANHCPVEVDEGDVGTAYRVMATCAGDWRKVKRWRQVTLSKTELEKLKKET